MQMEKYDYFWANCLFQTFRFSEPFQFTSLFTSSESERALLPRVFTHTHKELVSVLLVQDREDLILTNIKNVLK